MSFLSGQIPCLKQVLSLPFILHQNLTIMECKTQAPSLRTIYESGIGPNRYGLENHNTSQTWILSAPSSRQLALKTSAAKLALTMALEPLRLSTLKVVPEMWKQAIERRCPEHWGRSSRKISVSSHRERERERDTVNHHGINPPKCVWHWRQVKRSRLWCSRLHHPTTSFHNQGKNCGRWNCHWHEGIHQYQ